MCTLNVQNTTKKQKGKTCFITRIIVQLVLWLTPYAKGYWSLRKMSILHTNFAQIWPKSSGLHSPILQLLRNMILTMIHTNEKLTLNSSFMVVSLRDQTFKILDLFHQTFHVDQQSNRTRKLKNIIYKLWE